MKFLFPHLLSLFVLAISISVDAQMNGNAIVVVEGLLSIRPANFSGAAPIPEHAANACLGQPNTVFRMNTYQEWRPGQPLPSREGQPKFFCDRFPDANAYYHVTNTDRQIGYSRLQFSSCDVCGLAKSLSQSCRNFGADRPFDSSQFKVIISNPYQRRQKQLCAANIPGVHTFYCRPSFFPDFIALNTQKFCN